MENKSGNCNDFEIRVARIEDKQGIFQFIKKYFYTGEPLNEALTSLGRGFNHLRTLDNCPLLGIDEGLSFIVLTNSGEIMAFIHNATVRPENHLNRPELNSDEKQFRKLLGHVHEQITAIAGLDETGKELEIKTLTVHDGWRNKGIAKRLLEKTKDLAQEKGFKQIQSTCTSAYSAKLFLSCGFECVYSLKYEDWKKEGYIDFLPHPPHFYVNGMVLRF